MKLMTKEIEKALEKTGYEPPICHLIDAPVIVKYSNPCGYETWLVVGGQRDGDDWILHNYGRNLYGWSWGTVFLSDLASYKGRLGLGIERDLYCDGMTVRELCK